MKRILTPLLAIFVTMALTFIGGAVALKVAGRNEMCVCVYKRPSP